jgi:formylglycine-generating enzyme required for sulfatase activity/predicted Ser/Thr protein kinase
LSQPSQTPEAHIVSALVRQGAVSASAVSAAERRAVVTHSSLIEIMVREGTVLQSDVDQALLVLHVEVEDTADFTAQPDLDDTVDPEGLTWQPAPAATHPGGLGRTHTGSGLHDAKVLDDWAASSDRFEILSVLGHGGAGIVRLARDRLLNREVALKSPTPAAKTPAPPEQLLIEAQITSLLDHPGVVPVYDVGRDEAGQFFYTMRVVNQPNLADLLTDGGRPLGGKQIEDWVLALKQACLTVQYAHDHGVIHRDIKPQNILLGDYGEVYVVDWGMARVVDETLGLKRTNVEPDGQVIGTLRYMSPEQLTGSHSSVDKRSDVYSLGAVLYFILTGTSPFVQESVIALREAVLNTQPILPHKRVLGRQIPIMLSEICMRALNKEPSDRFQSAKELADALSGYLDRAEERSRAGILAQGEVVSAGLARHRWERLIEELASTRDGCRAVREALPSWAAAQEKAPLWEMEARAEALEVELERAFAEAVRGYRQALTYQADMGEATTQLTELYWWRMAAAERDGMKAAAAGWEALVGQTGGEEARQRLTAGASLHVVVPDRVFQGHISRFEERSRRLVTIHQADITNDSPRVDGLHQGSYLLTLLSEGSATMAIPLVLHRGDEKQLSPMFHASDSVPQEFVVVSASTSEGVSELESIGPFALMRYPVTCREYLDFLNTIRHEDPAQAMLHAPRIHEDAPSYFTAGQDGAFSLPQADQEGDTWQLDWPIIMVNNGDCLAYCAWKSARDGFDYRLPSSAEWQRAARGLDGRRYPWGDHFDATFCCMRESTRERALPANVGTYPTDRSPYGIMDMAGNVAEWTSTAPNGQSQDEVRLLPDGLRQGAEARILEGAAYNSVEFVCSLDFNLTSPTSFRHGHYGFRLAMSL